VETRLGTLNFFDGFPDKPTAEKLFDNLDFQRAVQAYLLAIPAASQVAGIDLVKKFTKIYPLADKENAQPHFLIMCALDAVDEGQRRI
jgi:hypothetical protein